MTFRAAHAGVAPDGATDGAVEKWQGWHDLAGRCLDRLTAEPGTTKDGFGLLYVSEPLAAELPAILDHVVTRTGIADWVGAAAPAICAGGSDYFDGPAMAAMVCDIPADDYHIVRGGTGDADTLAGWAVAHRPTIGIVHGDPRSPAVMSMAPELAAASGAFLVGGLAGAVSGNQIAGGVTEGGLSGILLGDGVAVATGLTQGCSPIGPVRTVTAMADEAIAELDGEPALAAFRGDIGEVLARDLRRVAGCIHGAIPVAGSDTGDYLVRNLAALDPAEETVTIATALREGDRVMFVRRDAASAVEDMDRMLDTLQRRIGDRGVHGGVYHSCVARGPNQFGSGARETAAIQARFGGIPLIGFFGNGEISHDRLYTYTGVLTLFLD
ncbi:MAG: FIST N-terminal domain-containing protein [Alphaproteobacteria bacterium]|jgi:small ligand-binding sensory domain FIST